MTSLTSLSAAKANNEAADDAVAVAAGSAELLIAVDVAAVT